MRTLDSFPKVRLGIFPTPVHRLDRISEILGTNVYIKRDDLTGLGLGGNKVRKLEYLLADAREQGAEIVFTTGGAQSNHAMLTAAAACKLGMKAVLLLQDEEDAYRFFEDICTIPEIRSISQRLEVAELLRRKETYQKIAEETGASSATISRVNRALVYGADGYNRVLEKMEKE